MSKSKDWLEDAIENIQKFAWQEKQFIGGFHGVKLPSWESLTRVASDEDLKKIGMKIPKGE